MEGTERSVRRGVASLGQAALVRAAGNDLHRWAQPSWLQFMPLDWFERLPVFPQGIDKRLTDPIKNYRTGLIGTRKCSIILNSFLGLIAPCLSLLDCLTHYQNCRMRQMNRCLPQCLAACETTSSYMHLCERFQQFGG